LACRRILSAFPSLDADFALKIQSIRQQFSQQTSFMPSLSTGTSQQRQQHEPQQQQQQHQQPSDKPDVGGINESESSGRFGLATAIATTMEARTTAKAGTTTTTTTTTTGDGDLPLYVTEPGDLKLVEKDEKTHLDASPTKTPQLSTERPNLSWF